MLQKICSAKNDKRDINPVNRKSSERARQSRHR